ncbi:MAG: hypothetical protein ACXWVD_00150 [Telluria sp.]
MTTWYVDASRPDDAGAGTSPASAKRTFKAAYLLAVAGDTILLRAGYCYAPVNGFFPRIQKDGLTLGAYDLGSNGSIWLDYPTLDGLTYEPANAAGWTYEGDGIWSKRLAGAKPRRMWAGSTSAGVRTTERVLGTAYSRTPNATADELAAIKVALGRTDIWHPAGSALGYKTYVYTGTALLTPPQYYEGLAFLLYDGASVGAADGVFVSSCSDVQVQYLHTRGVYGDSFIVTSGVNDARGTASVLVQNCIASAAMVGGFVIRHGFENTALDPLPITSVTIDRCIGDSSSSRYEQDRSTAYTHLSYLDMFLITGVPSGCTIQDSESINSAHVGAAIGSAHNGVMPVNCAIERVTVRFDDWITYGRGLATGKCADSCGIYDCTVIGQNVRSQFVNGEIVGNTWTGNRASIRKAGTDEWFVVEAYVSDSGPTLAGDDRYVRNQPSRLVIAHNVCIDPHAIGGFPAELTSYAAGLPVADVGIPTNTVTIANNVLYDRLAPTGGRAWLACFQNGAEIGYQKVLNNAIYTGAGKPAATVKWKGTASGVNGVAGATGNITVDPKLDLATLQPLSGSPLIGAGAPLTLARSTDSAGMPYQNPPSIGGYEYYATTASSSVTGTTRQGQRVGGVLVRQAQLTASTGQGQRAALLGTLSAGAQAATSQRQRMVGALQARAPGTAHTMQGQKAQAQAGLSDSVAVQARQAQRATAFGNLALEVATRQGQRTQVSAASGASIGVSGRQAQRAALLGGVAGALQGATSQRQRVTAALLARFPGSVQASQWQRAQAQAGVAVAVSVQSAQVQRAAGFEGAALQLDVTGAQAQRMGGQALLQGDAAVTAAQAQGAQARLLADHSGAAVAVSGSQVQGAAGRLAATSPAPAPAPVTYSAIAPTFSERLWSEDVGIADATEAASADVAYRFSNGRTFTALEYD